MFVKCYYMYNIVRKNVQARSVWDINDKVV